MMDTTMHESAIVGAVGPEARPGRPGGLLARLGGALMRRVRAAAWDLLDLHTDFETLD